MKKWKRKLSSLLIFMMLITLLNGLTSAVAAEPSEQAILEAVLAGEEVPPEAYAGLDESSVPEAVGMETAKERMHVKRLYEEEGDALNSVVFQNADDSRTLYIFPYPVKYVSESGEIKDISLNLRSDGSKAGTYRSAASGAQTVMPRNLSEGISLSSPDVELTLLPVAKKASDASGKVFAARTALTAFPAATKLDEKTVSYVYDEKTTLEYSLTYTGFKEDIVVREYTGQTEYEFLLQTNGLVPKESNGSFYLCDTAGNVRASIGDIVIFTADERNNALGSLSFETIQEKQTYRFVIHVDADYLRDEKTAYPIRIDPSIEISYDKSGSGAIEDVTINSKSGSLGSSGSIMVGLRSENGISRMLMRFPTLSLSGIPSADCITSASVELRDLMCESEALTVSCHPFTGNTWKESTANWSNVSPNSYGGALSSHSISYANGKKQATAHRYSFDITAAVRGWKNGNYSQSKGLLFKAAGSVESGGKYIHKTIASYNRAAYRPSLTVNYYASSAQLVPDGTYYLNNKYSGDYLKCESAKFSVVSGLLTTLGPPLYWLIRKVDGGYVIRSANDTSKYLAAPSDVNSVGVELVTVTNGAIPARCKWTITNAAGIGSLIKNVYNSSYLYTYGSSLNTSRSLGASGSTQYEAKGWRLVKTSQYGHTSSFTYCEMSAGTSIAAFSEAVGESNKPTVKKQNSKEIWCSPSDFIYSGYSSAIISIDALTGTITGKRAGATTVTATHKVTGRVVRFNVTINKLLIYQTAKTYSYDENGNLPEDLQYGDMTKDEIRALDWINWVNFAAYTKEEHLATWTLMCTTAFSQGELKEVISDMIRHFANGSGSDYWNSDLTAAAFAHESTQTYISLVQEQIVYLMKCYGGNIARLTYVAEQRKKNPLVVAMGNNDILEPVFNTPADKINGLTICVDGLWGNKIEVSSFVVSGNSFTCSLHYTLYDHFGLDQEDIKKYGVFSGFQSWYILQHYDQYKGLFLPFLTLMEFSTTFSGSLE